MEKPAAPLSPDPESSDEPVPTPPAEEDDLDRLLAAAAARVVEGVSPADFVAWLVAEAPRVAPRFGEALRSAPEGDRTAGFARGLWNRFPQPDNRFRPRPIPVPNRNEPCPCGSGLKYKRCCLATEAPRAALDGLPLLLHVLDRYPDRALDGLDPATMDPDELLHVLDTWAAEGDGERVVRLALPLFDPTRRRPRHAAEVLDILLAAWPRGFRERTFERSVAALANDADTGIAAIATATAVRELHARAPQTAWRRLDRERGRFADDPAFAALEVDLLADEGRTEAAMAAATRWREHLLSLDPELVGLGDALLERARAVDPEVALERLRDENDVLDRLLTLLEETPYAPIAGLCAPLSPPRDARRSRRALVLAPTPILADAERRWRERLDAAGPERLAASVEHLDDEPLALSSFAVLESLAREIDGGLADASVVDADAGRAARGDATGVPSASWRDALALRVLERAERLLYRHVSHEVGFETAEGLPDWDATVWETAPLVARRHPENRAALALLETLAARLRVPYADETRAATLERALHGLDPERTPDTLATAEVDPPGQ